MNRSKNDSGSISISGIAALGETLTAKINDANGVSVKDVSYQWMAGGNPIKGATESTYTPDSGVIESRLSVQATYKDNDGFSERVMSRSTSNVIDSIADRVQNSSKIIVIDNHAKLGETLSVKINETDSASDNDISYQWMAGGNSIKGATKSTYTPDSGVVGSEISVKVSYKNDAGVNERPESSDVENGIVGGVENNTSAVPNINDGSITISGNKTGVLTAKINDADGISKSGTTYQWYANGRLIEGAEKSTYKLTSDEASKTITVKASYTDNNGATETVVSDNDATVFAPKPATSLVVDVRDYGAKGDGRTDDTVAIQKAVNYVSRQGGGTVHIPDGDYMIDTTNRIWMRSNVTVKMEDDTVLEAIPNNQGTHYVFFVRNVDNVHISGGTIIGDRDEHYGNGGHYGVGIGILGSKNVTVENVNIQDFRGDGVYIGKDKGKSEDVVLYNIVSDNNLRQGITIVDGDNIQIINSIFKNTNGARPGAGIDIEPNNNELVSNVDILSSKFLNNEGRGIVISETVKGKNHEINNIIVDGNEVIGNGSDVRINGVSHGQFTNNYIDGVDTALTSDGRVLASVVLNNKSNNIEVSGNTIVTTGNEVRRADIDDRGTNNDLHDNIVIGTSGRDSLIGSLDSEILDGGAGRDILIGNAGADIFMFSSKLGGSNIDKITDFSSRQNDKIGLSDVIFGDFEDQGLGNDWFASSSKKVDGETRIIQKGNDLYFDADGSGTAYAEVQFAEVNRPLAVDDFVIM